MKKLAAIGLNHRTAPVEVRERVSYAPDEQLREAKEIYRLDGIAGVVILSTCNRTEMILHGTEERISRLPRRFADRLGMEQDLVAPLLYHHEDDGAVTHIFRVASALDSMILGEPQILGQVKQAFGAALDAGITDTVLNILFQRAFHVAKEVRTRTRIGESAVSVSYAAVEIARKIFGNLAGRSCAVIGAGEMCELAARHLVENGVGRITVFNRTARRAEDLADLFEGTGFGLDKLDEMLPESDVIVSSTGSSEPVLTAETVRKSQRSRHYEPQLIVDIAVPRDVEEEVREIRGVYLYDIDDLEGVVEANRKERESRAREAENLVEAAVQKFMKKLGELHVGPAIQEIRSRMDRIRREELERCFKSLGDLNEDQKRAVERFSVSLLNKYLHHPLVQIRDVSREESAIRLIRKIFGLKEEG